MTDEQSLVWDEVGVLARFDLLMAQDDVELLRRTRRRWIEATGSSLTMAGAPFPEGALAVYVPVWTLRRASNERMASLGTPEERVTHRDICESIRSMQQLIDQAYELLKALGWKEAAT